MADDSITIPQLNPVVFDKPQLDAFTQAFQPEGQNPPQSIAREIAG